MTNDTLKDMNFLLPYLQFTTFCGVMAEIYNKCLRNKGMVSFLEIKAKSHKKQ